MMKKYFLFLVILTICNPSFSQAPVQPRIRVADTLSQEEKKLSNRVILQSELDSLILQAQRVKNIQVLPYSETEPEGQNGLLVPLVLSLAIVLLIGLMGGLYFRQQRLIIDKLDLMKWENENSLMTIPTVPPGTRNALRSTGTVEQRIPELKSELLKLATENEGLNSVIREYNGIQKEFSDLKKEIFKVYKVKNYPGYPGTRGEQEAMKSLFETEQAFAALAFENFLKPILAITDANKNSPARIAPVEKEKLLDLMFSLSLLYIEYLYLRIPDLSIGGNMVTRLHTLSKGKGLDISSLKKLDTEFGSRALVVRMALSHAGLRHIEYPVFDETNLNTH